MSYELNGQSIEATDSGYLVNHEDWSEEVASVIAAAEGITLSDKAWDILKFLREEYFENNGNQPNERNMVKHFKKIWYPDLFDRRNHKNWNQDGGRPLETVLREKVQQLLESHQPEPLPDDVIHTMESVLERAEQTL